MKKFSVNLLYMSQIKRPALRTKIFFSSELTLKLELSPHGGLEGTIHPFNQMPDHKLTLGGIYVHDESVIRLTFFSTSDSSENLLRNESVFSGHIINYEEERNCLFLRKFEELEFYNIQGHLCVDDHLVLFDHQIKNPAKEVSKVPFLDEVRESMQCFLRN